MSIRVIDTEFNGLKVLEPKVIGDARGYFMESYNKKALHDAGVAIDFVQDNQSRSRKGVLRGLHFQRPPYAQTKLVRALTGDILDVVVDLRKAEPTFGRHFTIALTGENKKQLLVPKGFAHGFVVLSETAEVFYKCDEFYHPESDGGVHSMSVGIDWQLPASELLLSEKDSKLPALQDLTFQF